MAMHRVRIAGDMNFYAATENKKAVAYVSLVEDRQKRQADGTYAEADPNWFDGTFRGGWAEALNESYRAGDAILVDAEIEKHSFQKEGGDVVRSMKMYVSAFGPDAIRARVAIDRTPRAERFTKQEQAADAAADAESDIAAERDPRDAPTAPSRAQVESELHSRLSELVDKNRVSPAAATQVMDVFHEFKSADSEALATAVNDTAKVALPPVEANWVASVPTTLVTGYKPLSWDESERMVQSLQQHAPQLLEPAPTASPAM